MISPDRPIWPNPNDADENPHPPKHCGLGLSDRAILEAHIEAGTIHPTKVWWNLTVGSPPSWSSDPSITGRLKWIEDTYCKRPDLVYEQDTLLHIAEIKPYASYVAFGQAEIYLRLARLKLNPIRPIVAVILTDIPDPDLRMCITPSCPQLIQIGHHVVPRPSRIT